MRKIQLWFYGIGAVMMFIVACVGCANVSYISPSGESFHYNRLGTQKISGFQLVKDKDGLIKVKFDTQEGAEGKMFSDIAETLKNLSGAAKIP